MIVIALTPQQKHPLVCTIRSDNGPLTTNISTKNIPVFNDLGCSICHGLKAGTSCNLLNSLSPVLYYFSDIVSHEEVMIDFKKDRYHSQYPETAQNACFMVCIYTMFYSSCKYFGQFKFLLNYYRANINPEAYMHMILTTALIRRQVDFNRVHDHVDLFHEVETLCQELKQLLSHVFNEAKFFQDKDAAVNAINIAFSLNTLSAENLKYFYEGFIKQINSI
jgi:hypothetical protein